MGWRIPVTVASLVIIKGSGSINGVIFDLDGAVFDGAITMTSPTGGAGGVPGILITSPSDFNSPADNSQAAIGLAGESADGGTGPYVYVGSGQAGSPNIQSGQEIIVGDLGFGSGGVPGGSIRANIGAVIAPTGDTSGAKDFAKINSLLNLGCRWIHFLPGTYVVIQSIPLPTSAVLEGEGATIKTVAGGTYGAGLITLATPGSQFVTVRGLTLQDSFTTGLDGVNFTTTGLGDPQNYLDHVTATGFGGNGFTIANTTGSSASKLVSCKAFANVGNGFGLANDIQFTLCEAFENTGHGFSVGTNCMGSTSKAFLNGKLPGGSFTGTTSCGFALTSGSVNTTLGNCSAQQNALHGFALGATSGSAGFAEQCVLDGCESDTNSAATSGVGSGVFGSGLLRCAITGTTGKNSAGPPGSQLWGIQLEGTCTGTLLDSNSAVGTSGFLDASGATGLGIQWTALTVSLAAWANTGTAEVALQYRLRPQTGDVEVIGDISGTAIASSASQIVATLPGGFFNPSFIGPVQPVSIVSGTIAAGQDNPFCFIDTSGLLKVSNCQGATRLGFRAVFPLSAIQG